MDLIQLISQGIAIIAVLIAIWQAYLSKQQLEKAKETRNETEKLLDDIKDRVKKIDHPEVVQKFFHTAGFGKRWCKIQPSVIGSIAWELPNPVNFYDPQATGFRPIALKHWREARIFEWA